MKSERGYQRFGPVGPYYPAAAASRGLGGEAVLDCTMSAGGLLKSCKVVSETPRGMDFGAAARAMAQRGWLTAERQSIGGDFVDEPHVLVRVPFQVQGGAEQPSWPAPRRADNEKPSGASAEGVSKSQP